MRGKLSAGLEIIEEMRRYHPLRDGQHDRIRRSALRSAGRDAPSRQHPMAYISSIARSYKIVHAAIFADPPSYIRERKLVRKGVVVYDKYNRVLHRETPKYEVRVVDMKSIHKLPEFKTLFAPMSDYSTVKQDEKEKRVLAFIHMYAMSSLIQPAATAVGVPYYQLLIWINEDKTWQAAMRLANESASQLLIDVGRMKALGGDANMLRFFIEAENPGKYSKRSRPENDTDAPDDSVQSAIALILRANEEYEGRVKTLASIDPDDPAAWEDEGVSPAKDGSVKPGSQERALDAPSTQTLIPPDATSPSPSMSLHEKAETRLASLQAKTIDYGALGVDEGWED